MARKLGVSEFLIRQVMREDIPYFSYKMRKGSFLSQAMKDKKKEHAAKILNKTKNPFIANILCFFLRRENYFFNRIRR